MALTKQEKDAAAQSGQGVDTSNSDDVISLEEMALLYVSVGGDDPRAKAVVEAAKAAGRIDDNGNWIDTQNDPAGLAQG